MNANAFNPMTNAQQPQPPFKTPQPPESEEQILLKLESALITLVLNI